MPRPSRVHYPGGLFHIISRCLEKRFLLDGTEERQKYLELLEKTLRRTDSRVLAWCIMSNHVHLVVQAGQDHLSRLTKPVNSGYATWKNRKDQRIGPVFADRPNTVLVETEPYLLELVRYVHLNPVRAGLVTRAEDSTWTSHQCYSGHAPTPPWLDQSRVMDYFQGERDVAATAFNDFVADGHQEERRPDLVGEVSAEAIRELRDSVGRGAQLSDPMVGSPDFISRILKETGKENASKAGLKINSPGRIPGLKELVAAVCVSLDLDDETFQARPKARKPRLARQVVTYLWVKRFGKQQSEIVRYLNVGSDQVSRWFGKALDTLDELEPIIRRVAETMPMEEPLLARSGPQSITVNVELLED